MLFTHPSWQKLAGQNDVQSSLHVPTVYVDVPPRPLLWEYRVLTVDTREEPLPDEAALNELGSQGWLLTNILEQRLSETGSRVHYHFMRPKEA
jgi:hypothetical protein